MTEDNAWKIIDNLNWPGGDNERIKELLRNSCTLAEQIELLDFMDAKWESLNSKFEAANLPFGQRDDADLTCDTISDIVSRGRQTYEAALAEPSLVYQWYDRQEPEWEKRKLLYDVLLQVVDESFALAE